MASDREGSCGLSNPDDGAGQPPVASTSTDVPNLLAFDGLRGVLALWVALGHFTQASTWRFNLLNTFAMPLFFMISGYAPPRNVRNRFGQEGVKGT
jgi:peptidoglycan/LPS O-acetylase OafA/YrhL